MKKSYYLAVFFALCAALTVGNFAQAKAEHCPYKDTKIEGKGPHYVDLGKDFIAVDVRIFSGSKCINALTDSCYLVKQDEPGKLVISKVGSGRTCKDISYITYKKVLKNTVTETGSGGNPINGGIGGGSGQTQNPAEFQLPDRLPTVGLNIGLIVGLISTFFAGSQIKSRLKIK
jgi:hypothetical protein